MEKQYLTEKEIGALLGLKRGTISSYKAKGRMPKPDMQYGRTPLWLTETINEWRQGIK